MHTFVANFLGYVTTKYYLNWIIFSQVFAKVKRVTFFETQCRLKSYFSRHCDMTQFTLTHHMINKPFLLLGLAAEYRSRRQSTVIRSTYCRRPSDVYDTHRRTKLTALETISRWLLLQKNEKIALWATLSGLRGNVRTPSIALWKARGRFPIRDNWIFSLSLTAVSYTHLTLPTIYSV